jgi:hypothetical protein
LTSNTGSTPPRPFPASASGNAGLAASDADLAAFGLATVRFSFDGFPAALSGLIHNQKSPPETGGLFFSGTHLKNYCGRILSGIADRYSRIADILPAVQHKPR